MNGEVQRVDTDELGLEPAVSDEYLRGTKGSGSRVRSELFEHNCRYLRGRRGLHRNGLAFVRVRGWISTSLCPDEFESLNLLLFAILSHTEV